MTSHSESSPGATLPVSPDCGNLTCSAVPTPGNTYCDRHSPSKIHAEQRAQEAVWRRLSMRPKGEPKKDSLRAVMLEVERGIADAENVIKRMAPQLAAARRMFDQEVAKDA